VAGVFVVAGASLAGLAVARLAGRGGGGARGPASGTGPGDFPNGPNGPPRLSRRPRGERA
jgi:hypothetical protein